MLMLLIGFKSLTGYLRENSIIISSCNKTHDTNGANGINGKRK